VHEPFYGGKRTDSYRVADLPGNDSGFDCACIWFAKVKEPKTIEMKTEEKEYEFSK